MELKTGEAAVAEGYIDSAIDIAKRTSSYKNKDNYWGNACLIKAQAAYKQSKVVASENYYSEALLSFRKSPEKSCPMLVATHKGIGLNHLGLSRHSKALNSFNTSLEIAEKYHCLTPGVKASVYNNIGLVLNEQKQYDAAIEYLNEALELYQSTPGLNSQAALSITSNLAEIYRRVGKEGAALQSGNSYFSSVIARLEKRMIEQDGAFAKDFSRGTQGKSLRNVFSTIARSVDDVSPDLFTAYQLAKINATNTAYSAMLHASSRKSSAVSKLIKERRGLLASFEQGDLEGTGDSQTVDIINKLTKNRERITSIDPDFFAIYLPDYVSLTELQSILADDEAILAYFYDHENIYVINIQANSTSFHRSKVDQYKHKIDRSKFDEDVKILKQCLNPLTQSMYPAVIGHRLFQQLIDPLRLDGNIKKLLVVPDQVVESVPFSALIASPPPESRLSLRKLDWLVDWYAISYYPSLSTIYSLRSKAKNTGRDRSLLAFANPHFNDLSQPYRAISVKKIYDKAGKTSLPFFRDIANLPETQEEVESIAALFPAHSSKIYTWDDASEYTVNSTDLSRYRYIVFATHGLVSGDFDGLKEPALVLTPPARISGSNDGLLKASEISGLDLNSDLTVLSACNTASTDGEFGAEGLSGLAKSFMYAGSRALLVSHWPVNSHATVLTTTTFFKNLTGGANKDKTLALQKQNRDLRKSTPIQVIGPRLC